MSLKSYHILACGFLALWLSPALLKTFELDLAPSKLEWLTEKTHDFGTIPRDRPVQHVFKFRNNFSEDIRLETVRTSCGCTAAKWTESAIAPGQMGEVLIEYDAYMRGGFNKKIRVFFDKQKKPEILRISGEVD